MDESATKRCTKCGEVKALTEFHRNAQSRDGLSPSCRACKSKVARGYYAANREAVMARTAGWYRENRERARVQHREYYEANRAADLSRRHDRYEANIEAERETQRKYRAQLRAAVFGHYGTACACCGSTKRLSIDHIGGNGAEHRQEIQGRRNGGGSQFWRWLVKQSFPEGYQTLCLPCNQSKGTTERCRLDHTT